MSTAASHASFLLPLEQPLRRAPLTGALCKSALTRAFRPTFSFCMALRASLTEFTTFTMLIWLSDSSCNTQSGSKEWTRMFMHNHFWSIGITQGFVHNLPDWWCFLFMEGWHRIFIFARVMSERSLEEQDSLSPETYLHWYMTKFSLWLDNKKMTWIACLLQLLFCLLKE